MGFWGFSENATNFLKKKISKIASNVRNTIVIDDSDDSEDKSLNSFQCVLNDISDRLDAVREQTLVTRCERMYLFFDEFVEALCVVSRQLHTTPFDSDDEDDGEEVEEDDGEEVDEDDTELLQSEDKGVPEKKKSDSLFSGFWVSTLDKLD